MTCYHFTSFYLPSSRFLRWNPGAPQTDGLRYLTGPFNNFILCLDCSFFCLFIRIMYDASEISGATERMYSIYIYYKQVSVSKQWDIHCQPQRFLFWRIRRVNVFCSCHFSFGAEDTCLGGIKQFKCMENLRDFPLIQQGSLNFPIFGGSNTANVWSFWRISHK